jgi:hypothetical protein
MRSRDSHAGGATVKAVAFMGATDRLSLTVRLDEEEYNPWIVKEFFGGYASGNLMCPNYLVVILDYLRQLRYRFRPPDRLWASPRSLFNRIIGLFSLPSRINTWICLNSLSWLRRDGPRSGLRTTATSEQKITALTLSVSVKARVASASGFHQSHCRKALDMIASA